MDVSDVGDFPLIGEHLALDLINTRVRTRKGETDLLSTPTALEAWVAAQDGRLPSPDAPLTESDLAAVHTIREQVATAVEPARAGSPPPEQALNALNALTAAQREAAAYRELSWDQRVVTATPRRIGDYRARLVAELADAATDLLTNPSIDRVRQCEGRDCVLLFLPEHPRRRWCSPACGNRARVARYYQRHRHS